MKHFTVFCLAVLISCNTATRFPELHEFSIADGSFTGKIIFQKLAGTTGFKVLLENQSGEITDQTVFRYTPYRFDTADG